MVSFSSVFSQHPWFDVKESRFEIFIQKANLGLYERAHLRTDHLTKAWGFTRVCDRLRGCLYGQHKEIETVSHTVDMTARRNEPYESNWGKHPFQSSPSAAQCIFVSHDLYQFLKHIRSLKGNVENREGHPVSTPNARSNHSEHRLRLHIHSTTSEKNFINDGENSQYNQLEGSVSNGSLFLHQQTGSLQSKMCNVDNNGRDLIHPSLFDAYCDRANIKQLFMCNNMSQALNRSYNPTCYQNIYDGARNCSCNDSGYNIEQDSDLRKHRAPQPSDKDSKSNTRRNIFY